jgi:hypothetical protein
MTGKLASSEEIWKHEFSEVDAEISKMAALCGIDMLDRAQLRRVLEDDATVCTRDNELAFGKLHTLLKAHYLLRDRAAARIGEAATQKAIDEVVAELVRRFSAARSGEAPH